MILGYTESHNGSVLRVTPASWAPGVWAGMEGTWLENGAQILAIDLNTRTLHLSEHQGALAEGCPIRIDVERSFPEASRVRPIANTTFERFSRLVRGFSYKANYRLHLEHDYIRDVYNLTFTYVNPTTSGNFYQTREVFSAEIIPHLTEALIKHKIFLMINELEKKMIIDQLKFDGVKYLSNNQD